MNLTEEKINKNYLLWIEQLKKYNCYSEELIEEYGDKIKIDIPTRSIELLVSDEELQQRRENLKTFEPKVKSGYLAKYASNVSDASHGAIV